MHILIAPNAFKHSLNAQEAAKAIQGGLLASRIQCSSELFPIGDGGNGTGRLLVEKYAGKEITVWAQDPLGRTIETSYGVIDEGRTAIIEMASASGLHLLKQTELNPLIASSYGTGQLIKFALDQGIKKIIIALGGSATIDGGSGLLQALGVRFLNTKKEVITNLPRGLMELDDMDLSGLDARLLQCEIVVLCDVTNPLLGKNGAAHVFGRQKGADAAMVNQLEKILGRYAETIARTKGIKLADLPYSGVAGGASAGLKAVLNAKLVNGIDYFLELTHFEKALAKTDLVITGEGSIDVQTLQGKGPFGVARRAKGRGITVIGLAGVIPPENNNELNAYFDLLLAIGNGPSTREKALSSTAQHLHRTAVQLGNFIGCFTTTSGIG